ncbi:DegT/DnrJ/EryC1/StrS family aminotransferase [Fusibacter bizertensis]
MIKLAFPEIGVEEIELIAKVIESKQLVMGKEVEQFESLIKSYLGVKHCFAVTSGTAALHLALMAIDIKPDDEVIVPAFTFPATANVVEVVGANTKFVDVNLNDYCIDISQIESAITERTKAIIVVHEFGNAVEMSKINEIAQKHNLKVIEDAACALGSMDGDHFVGTLSDIGCFSLHPRKSITTGEGGLITTNSDEYAQKIKQLRNHGIEYQNGKPRFLIPGLNYRMNNIQAAIGIVQFSKMNEILDKKRTLVQAYFQLLDGIDGMIIPKQRANSRHTWQTYHIVLDRKIDRDEVIALLKDRGVETNYGANAVNLEPYYFEKYKKDDLHFAAILYQQGLALPLHSGMEIVDVEYVVKTLLEVIAKF